MFDKYFGFLKSHDEESIIQSLLDHAKIDSEELHILSQMLTALLKNDTSKMDGMIEQINRINEENHKLFETVSDHIVQSNFDFQKQYDLLRVQQRIDGVSELIIATAKRIMIAKNIETNIPTQLTPYFNTLCELVLNSQDLFIKTIQKFQVSRKDALKLIHQVEEQENFVDNARAESLEVLFRLANDNQLKLGDCLAIEGIIEYLEDISDAITSACKSLDWLLIN